MKESIFKLHRLLWQLRNDPAVADEARRDPEGFVRSHHLDAADADALMAQDFAALLQRGANPLLLYFGALEMGVARDDFYRRVRKADA